MSRIKSTQKNIIYALAGQFAYTLVSFIARMVFVQTLGAEYLGINGLFTGILSVLSLAELGVGGAIIYSLYKPLAEGDGEKIKSLMALLRKAYVVIGCAVLVLGLSLTPFLGFFIAEVPDIPHVWLIYMMFVANSGMSYFFAYKRSLIIADQKHFITTMYHYTLFFCLNVAQIAVLMVSGNYLLFLVLMLVATATENILISRKADRLFPLLCEKDVEKLEKTEKAAIFKNVYALSLNRVGAVVVLGMNSLLLAKYAGIVVVGLYSNYQLVITALNGILSQVVESITASIGHLGVTESDEKKLAVFNVFNFAMFWILGFASICLFILFNPLISLWLGDAYLFDTHMVGVIVVNFYLLGMKSNPWHYRSGLGLYWFARYKPVIQSAIYLSAAIWLGGIFGAMGVLIALTVAILATCFWVEPYVLYRRGFHGPVSRYFLRYAIYTSVCVVAGLITYGAVSFITVGGIWGFIVMVLICVVMPNAVFFAAFRKTVEFRYLREMVMGMISHGLKRKECHDDTEEDTLLLAERRENARRNGQVH